MVNTAPITALPGCTLCRKGAYGASWPPPERIAVNGDGPEYLHLCSACGTYWKFDMRFANPLPLERARQDFPAHFTNWSPSGSKETSLRVRSGVSFPVRDPLAPGGEPPEGKLEEMLASHTAAQSGDKLAAGLLPLLRASLLQVPSTTEPATDGLGMTPLALNRPPIVWILAFTQVRLARRFAADAPFCLELYGSDLIACLPHHFGLHLNFGAGSECRIGPETFGL